MRNGDTRGSNNAVRIAKVATLSMIVLVWIVTGVLIILAGCNNSPSCTAAWHTPTLLLFWTAIGGIVLCILIIIVSVAFMPSKSKETASEVL
jgi:magnesium-transporting ATPase (P-type)